MAPTLGYGSSIMAPFSRRQRAGSLVGDLDFGTEGVERLDVEVDGPAADAVAANHGHESLAGQVQQRPEQEHWYPVETAERQGHLGRPSREA